MATKQLSELDPHEVSLVPRGANKKKFLIFKAENGAQMDKETLDLIRKGDPEIAAKVEAVLKAHSDEMLAKDDGDGAMADDEVEKLHTALKAIGRIIAPMKDNPDCKPLMQKLMKELGMDDDYMDEDDADEASAEDDLDEVDKDAEDDADGGDDEEAEGDDGVPQDHASAAHQVGLAAYKKAHADTMKKLGHKAPAEQPTINKDGETVQGEGIPMSKKTDAPDLAALPEKTRQYFETVEKAQREAVEKADRLEAELKVERDIRREKEFSEKANGYKHIGADKAELASVLKSLEPETLKKVEAVLKAADEAIAKGDLFKEVGSGASGQVSGVTWEAIEAAATNMVAKSGEKVSKADSIAKFLETKEGRDMYAQHQANRPGGI